MNVRTNRRKAAGFTLVELAVVMLIISLMVTFLLVASYEGVQRANERATQALILKLDTALADRVDALSSLTPPLATSHRFLSQVVAPATPPPGFRLIPSEERALVIARLDFLRGELPDVFFVQDDANYPLNFAGQAYNPNNSAITYLHYMLPLGVGLVGESLQVGDFVPVTNEPTPLNVIDDRLQTGGSLAGRGIFGAHYGIAAGLYKQLGYSPQGSNGLDDDGDDLVDERNEGEFGLSPTEIADINQRLLNHKHETARSEMLYAILVEGQGPLGSFFQIEDFLPNEVGDTDQDGLNEFLDAWGKPLQFFRWPIYFNSDVDALGLQRGDAAYTNLTDAREQNPLDQNQELMTPSWWANLSALSGPQTSAMMSANARTVHRHLIGLVDPFADTGAPAFWDRTGFYKRRAFYSKFLIASGGPDLKHGIGLFNVDYDELSGTIAYGVPVPNPVPVANRDQMSFFLTAVEGQASRKGPVGRTSGANAGAANLYQGFGDGSDPQPQVTQGITLSWARDDVTNQTQGSPSTGVR